MAAKKKEVRNAFNEACLERDGYRCAKCGLKATPHDWRDLLDVHHIVDRHDLPNGGYVKENGISLCSDKAKGADCCHLKAEQYHISKGDRWEEGYHPDDLYKAIGSSFEEAWKASEELK